MAEPRRRARVSRSSPSRAMAGGCRASPRATPPARRCTRCSTRLGAARGIRLTHPQGLPLASGVGSSGASAVAAVVAVNELLGRPAPLDVLLECAMAGEVAGCGAAHPDNVAPALYGGFVLARTADRRPTSFGCRCPTGLSCAVLHPHLEVQTGAARALLGDTVPLRRRRPPVGQRRRAGRGAFSRTTCRSWRGRSRTTSPSRSAPIWCRAFYAVKQAARAAGALGCSLSGSGPSIFALCASLERAELAGQAMRDAFAAAAGVGADLWVSPVGAAWRTDCRPRSGPAPMKFVSTRGQAPPVSFRDGAVRRPGARRRALRARARSTPVLFAILRGASLAEVGTAIATRFVGDDIPRRDARAAARRRARLSDAAGAARRADCAVLELFHGPDVRLQGRRRARDGAADGASQRGATSR